MTFEKELITITYNQRNMVLASRELIMKEAHRKVGIPFFNWYLSVKGGIEKLEVKKDFLSLSQIE